MEDVRKLNMQMKDAENSSGLMVNPLQNMNLMDDFLLSGSYRCSDTEEWRAWI